MTAVMAGYHNKINTKINKTTENKSGYLKNNPLFDWQAVKCLEQWSRPDRLGVMPCASCLVSSVSVL